MIIEFNALVYLREMQINSHQFFIASKVDIAIRGESLNGSGYKRFGFFTLRSNIDTNYKLRELKTIAINSYLSQIKLSFHQCHLNQFNINRQVGIISLSFLGEYSNSPSIQPHLCLNNSKDQMKASPKEAEVASRLEELRVKKKRAIEREDYDEAKAVKAEIDRLVGVSSKPGMSKKPSRISDKDYQSILHMKEELDRLNIQMNSLEVCDRSYKMKQEQIPVQPMEDAETKQKAMNDNPGVEWKVKGRVSKKEENDVYHPIELYQYDIDKDVALINNEPVDMKLEKEEEGKSFNLNQFKQKPQRNPYDELQVGRHQQDFLELLNEKMNENNTFPSEDSSSKGDERIPQSLLNQYEDIISVLSEPIVKLVLSKNWESQAKGIEQLTTQIASTTSPFFTGQKPEAILYASFGACSIVLSSKAVPALLTSMNLIALLIELFPFKTAEEVTKTRLDHYSLECIRLLIEHLGHFNPEVKSKAEECLLKISSYPPIGNRLIFHQLIKGKSSKRHICSKIHLIISLFNHHASLPEDIALSEMMRFSIEQYQSPMKSIREAALKLIQSIYSYAGYDIREYLKALKPNQQSIVEDSLMETKVLSLKSKHNAQATIDIHSTDNDIVNCIQLSQQDIKEDNNRGLQCAYCYQVNSLKDLRRHYEVDCPMMITCSHCSQTLQISGLNFHLTNDCLKKAAFTICQRCKEAVLTEIYERHRAEKKCIPFKLPSMANRCPLCHLDITPPGKIGWEVHLLENNCPKNLRKGN